MFARFHLSKAALQNRDKMRAVWLPFVTALALILSRGGSAENVATAMMTQGPGIGMGSPAPAQDAEMNLLFIQQSTNGMIRMNNASSGSLIMNGVSRHTTWFSDRPHKFAGQVETTALVQDDGQFSVDWHGEPNAALYIRKPGPLVSTDLVVIVTLSGPAYNATSNTLTYTVKHHSRFKQPSSSPCNRKGTPGNPFGILLQACTGSHDADLA
eukprot:jgi/Botrbrau1/15188/Bobra.0149s0053.1